MGVIRINCIQVVTIHRAPGGAAKDVTLAFDGIPFVISAGDDASDVQDSAEDANAWPADAVTITSPETDVFEFEFVGVDNPEINQFAGMPQTLMGASYSGDGTISADVAYKVVDGIAYIGGNETTGGLNASEISTSHYGDVNQPYRHSFPITPDDDAGFVPSTRAILAGGAGDIKMKLADGTVLTVAFAAGEIRPFAATQVFDTGTDATEITGLY